MMNMAEIPSVCTFPLEYCEFGPRFSKCKDWLKAEHPDLYDRYYSEGAAPPLNLDSGRSELN